MNQVCSLRALPQPRFPLRRKRSVRSRAGTSVGKTRYFPLRLLRLCRATAKVNHSFTHGKVIIFYWPFTIMFRMAKSVDSKLIEVAAGDSLGIKHVRKIHFFREFPEKEGKLRTSHRVTTFSWPTSCWPGAVPTDARPARTEINPFLLTSSF